MLVASSLFTLALINAGVFAQASGGTGLHAVSSRTPLGNPSANVTVTEYVDLQCQGCKLTNDILNTSLLSKFGTKIRFEFKHFPLQLADRQSFDAAQASECAADQGKFWEFVHAIYAHQQDLGLDALRQMADSLHLNRVAFDRCLDSGEKAKIITNDREEGMKKNVHSVPAYFVDGQSIMQLDEQSLTDAISTAIEHQSGPSISISSKNLPKFYSGDYIWRQGQFIERVHLNIRNVRKILGGTDYVFRGWQSYGKDTKKRRLIQGRINPVTRNVKIYVKKSQSIDDPYQINLEFTGTISNDLSRIMLVSTTEMGNEHGDIIFRAADQ